MKEYIIMTLLLLPFEETFKVDSKLWLAEIKVTDCSYEVPTIYHEPPINKHEIIINGKKWQYVGKMCDASKPALLD